MVTITRAKTWVANETLTAAELNAEFDNINSELTSGDPVFESKLIVGVNDAGHDVQFFGAADGAYMLWDESANLLEIRGAAAAGPGHLKLTTAELTNVDGGILGRIDFQAPLDSAGTDAILVGASIWAEADATFSSSVNSTELVFATGTSETAAEKMRLTSDGTLRVASLFTTDIKIGEDDETKIDFETADEIHFYAANVEQVYLADNIFGPQSDSDVDLGTTGVRWKDAFVDSITVTGEVDGASLDISGNADIDGTTNLDAVDIDGAVQVDATVTVGVNDTGYDVKFFGATSGAYMLWDESADSLQIYKTNNEALLLDSGSDNSIYMTVTDDGSNSGAKIGYDVTNDSLALGHHDVGDVFRINASGAVTVGANTDGYDVKFFGNASGAYMLWDESADDLILGGAARLGIGTTDPSELLEVSGGDLQITHTAPRLALEETDGSSDENWDMVILSGILKFGTQNDAHTGFSGKVSFLQDGKVKNPVDNAGYYTGAGDDTRLYFDATNAVLATAGAMIFQTNGTTEAMRIDSSQNVGIGTNDPDGTLHVHTATAGTIAASGGGDDLVIENSTTVGMTFLSPNDVAAGIYFGDPESNIDGQLFYSHATRSMNIYTAGSNQFFFDSSGSFMINETSNANMTIGLTINQGTNDNEIFALKSTTDVSHGMTAYTENDTFFAITKDNAATGGATLYSYSEGNAGLILHARPGAIITTDTGSSLGACTIKAQQWDGGTDVIAAPATSNILAVTDGTNTRLIVKGNGTLHATNISDGSGDLDGVALDNEDDVGLLRTFERNLHNDVGVSMTKWDDQIKANEDDLKRVGVLSSESHFYNMQRMNSLLGGGIWQIHCRQQDLKEVVDYQQEEIESLKKELRLLKG